jgi:hypothetical protein
MFKQGLVRLWPFLELIIGFHDHRGPSRERASLLLLEVQRPGRERQALKFKGAKNLRKSPYAKAPSQPFAGDGNRGYRNKECFDTALGILA